MFQVSASLPEEKMMPFTSIIILNYNGKNLSLKCLQSLLDKTRYSSYEVLYVDNGSIDGSVEEVERAFGEAEKVKVVVLDKNYGYAEGNNLGYGKISKESKYVVILNNDVTVDGEDWLRTLVEFLEKHQDVGEAQPLILDPRDSRLNLYGYKMNVFGEFSPINEISDGADGNSHEGYNECFSALGAAIIVRRQLVDKIGLFNGQFFLDYEDADFSWRLRLLGFKVVCVHSSRVCHQSGATVDKYTRLPILYFHRLKNRIYILLLNYDLTNAIRYVPWVVFSYAYETMKIALIPTTSGVGKKQAAVRALVATKSLVYLLVNFRHIWKERLIVQERIRTVKDSEIIGEHIVRSRPLLLRRTKPDGLV
jgi:GT2 family glycosyltransferase